MVDFGYLRLRSGLFYVGFYTQCLGYFSVRFIHLGYFGSEARCPNLETCQTNSFIPLFASPEIAFVSRERREAEVLWRNKPIHKLVCFFNMHFSLVCIYIKTLSVNF